MKETYILNELKVAVINQDLKKIEELTNKTPTYSSIDEAKEILHFINEAKKLLNIEKIKLSQEMKKIKEIKKYNLERINSTFSMKS